MLMRSLRLLLALAALLSACDAAAREPMPEEQVCAQPGAVPRVTFRFVDGLVVFDDDPLVPDTDRLLGPADQLYIVRREVQVSGRTIADVWSTVERDTPAVSIRLDDAGASQLKMATNEGLGRQMALVVDGVVIVAPTINEPIEGGQLVISHILTEEDSEAMAARIRVAARGCVLPPVPSS